MRILVIEDNPEEMEIVVNLLKAEGVEVEVAYTRLQYVRKNEAKVDGILTDMFFPEENGEEPAPFGAAVALKAQKKGIPCIVCTSEYHHDHQLQWYHAICTAMNLPVVVDELGEDGHKKWKEAFEELKKLIENNR